MALCLQNCNRLKLKTIFGEGPMNSHYFSSKSFITLALVLLFVTSVTAQTLVVRPELLNPDVRVFFLSDFNFTGSGTTAGDIFAVTLSNISQSTKRVQLTMRIMSGFDTELASGTTAPFDLDPSPLGDIRINNRNLFEEAQQFTLQDFNLVDAGTELIGKLLSTGKLPSDIYTFVFIVTDVNNQIAEGREQIVVDVTNPSTLDLISPGAFAEAGAEIIEIFATLPQFRWESNMDLFRLIVAEKLPIVHDEASPEEIIDDHQGRRLDTYIRVGENGAIHTDDALLGPVEYVGSNVYQYPSSAPGVPILELGKIYYWQIRGIVETSGTPTELESEIWAFKIFNPNQGQSVSQEQFMEFLESLPGEGLLGELLSQVLSDLVGFLPTGVATINGVPMTFSELQNHIQKLLSGSDEFEIIEMVVF